MQHLKQLLIEKNISQTQLAHILGRNKSAVTNLLQGKRQLKAQEVVKIAAFLGVSESEILGLGQPSLNQRMSAVLAAGDHKHLEQQSGIAQPVVVEKIVERVVKIPTPQIVEKIVEVEKIIEVEKPVEVAVPPMHIPFHGTPSVQMRKSQCVKRLAEGYGFEDVFFATDHSYALEVPDQALDLIGFMPGDVVLSELGAKVKKDDIVVVQWYQENRVTITLRKYEPPFLVPYSSQPDIERLHEARANVQIVSPVQRLIRLF